MFHHGLYTLQIVQTKQQLRDLANILMQARFRFFDTEATGLRVRFAGEVDIVGWTFAVEDEISKSVYYIPTGHDFEGVYEDHIDFDDLGINPQSFEGFNPQLLLGNWGNVDYDLVVETLRPVFEDTNGIWIAHNISYDFHVLANCGIDILKILNAGNYYDTMVASHTINEEAEKKLETVIMKRFGLFKVDFKHVVKTVSKDEKKELGLKVNQLASFQHVQIPIGAYYSGEDVWFMKQLYPDLQSEMIDDGSEVLFRRLRMPFLAVLWKMERRGVLVNKKRLDEMEKLAKEELDNIKYEIYEISGVEFKLASGQQLAEILFGHRKVMVDKANGGYKVSCNENIVNANFGFTPVSWTEGGAAKDKKLKNPQTNAETLEELLEQEWNQKRGVSQDEFEQGKEVVKLLLKFARLDKLYTSFMKGLREQIYADGKVHPSFNICGTDSWRLSCDSPNLQQLPRPLELPKEPKEENFTYTEDYKTELRKYIKDKAEYDYWIRFEIRDLFIPDVPEDQVVIAGDWSNLEKRISAHFTKDPNLIRLFLEKLDGHGLIATIIFPELADVHPNDVKEKYKSHRQIAKGVGFAMDYGGTAFAVSRNLKIDKETAQSYIDRYFEGFHGIADWAVNQKMFGRKFGYVLTLLGHKRHLTGSDGGIRSDNIKIRSYYERLCLNSPVQGSAADIAMLAQISAENDPILRALGATMRIQIHDELVFVAPKKYKYIIMKRLKYLMENCLPHELVVPLISEVDYGSSYAEAK